MDHRTGPVAPEVTVASSDALRLVRRGARALVLDDDGRLLLIRRSRPGRVEYWTTPGGGVEDRETDEGAFHRELFEEAGATARLIRQVFLASLPREGGVAVQHFYLGRLLTLDVELRNGPEFDDPTRGAYDLELVDLRDLTALNQTDLWPEGLASFLVENRVALLLEAGLTP